MRIIQAKSICEIDWSYGPLFFLAGPVKGGSDWQHRACRLIRERQEKFYAIIPNRYPLDHPLMEFMINSRGVYDSQTLGERIYLEMAAGVKRVDAPDSRKGCIVIWEELESKIFPRNDHQPYSRDTYGEVGEWRGRMIYDPSIRLVMGAAEGFPGLEVQKKNFDAALKTNFPIYSTLESTIKAALERVK
jgi:hypothetical protein